MAACKPAGPCRAKQCATHLCCTARHLYVLHALAANVYSRVGDLKSRSGNYLITTLHGCLQTRWPLSSKAVVPVLCNTLVLYCKALVCAACMHALAANVYRRVGDLNSRICNYLITMLHGCLQTCWPLSSKAVVPMLCNTHVLYCKALVCAACFGSKCVQQSW